MVSLESEFELESESVVTILAESVALLDCCLEEEPLEDDLPTEDFPDCDLPEVLLEDTFGEVISSCSRLRHSGAT
jgi:hypothetical protein